MFEFETINDGTNRKRIKIENGKPVLKEKYRKSLNGLHPTYHFTKKGATLTINEDGTVNFKESGRVFGSDRFILYDYFAEDDANPIHNYGENLMNKFFNLCAISMRKA